MTVLLIVIMLQDILQKALFVFNFKKKCYTKSVTFVKPGLYAKKVLFEFTCFADIFSNPAFFRIDAPLLDKIYMRR